MTGYLYHMDAAAHLTNGCGLFQMMPLGRRSPCDASTVTES
jgi:hypothetical protein